MIRKGIKMKILEMISKTKTKMALRSTLTVWAENIEEYMDGFMGELKESYNTYELVSMADKSKPYSSPFSSAKYQEDLLDIRKSVLSNLDIAKVAIEENRKLVDTMHDTGKLEDDFYTEMTDLYEEVNYMILMAIIQVDVILAKYKGSTSIDLTVDFNDETVHVSSL